jgi:hypothetical protein
MYGHVLAFPHAEELDCTVGRRSRTSKDMMKQDG